MESSSPEPKPLAVFASVDHTGARQADDRTQGDVPHRRCHPFHSQTLDEPNGATELSLRYATRTPRARAYGRTLHVVTLHVVTGALSIPWNFRPYFRVEKRTQIGIAFKNTVDLARELIEAYTAATDEIVYVLMNSWLRTRRL